MLEVSQCLFSKCNCRDAIKDNTLLKVSLFISNFLPTIVGILAIQGYIPVSNTVAKIFCGIGIPLTLFALVRDCCSRRTTIPVDPAQSPVRRKETQDTTGQDLQQSKLDQDLSHLEKRVGALTGRLNALINQHQYIDTYSGGAGLKAIQAYVKSVRGNSCLGETSTIETHRGTLDYIEGIIQEVEGSIARSPPSQLVIAYQTQMQRVEDLKAKTMGLSQPRNNLLNILPKQEEMQQELAALQAGKSVGDPWIADYPRLLKEKLDRLESVLSPSTSRCEAGGSCSRQAEADLATAPHNHEREGRSTVRKKDGGRKGAGSSSKNDSTPPQVSFRDVDFKEEGRDKRKY